MPRALLALVLVAGHSTAAYSIAAPARAPSHRLRSVRVLPAPRASQSGRAHCKARESADESVAKSDADELPAGRAIWRSALPLYGACLCEPTLTLIDTACVGSLGQATTVGLAALAVNGAVFDVAANIFASLCTASTNVVGVASARGDRELRRAVSVSLAVAVVVGCVSGAALLGVSGPLATRVFGLAKSPDVARRALSYMRIRAAFTPVVCVNYVLYGVLLARADTSIAVRAVSLSALVNIALDVLLVGVAQLSTSGAAVATVAAQIAVCSTLLGHVRRTLPPAEAAAGAGDAAAAAGSRSAAAARWPRPTLAELRPFGAVFGAVGLGTLTTSAVHACAARLVASSGEVAATAAHQVGFQAVSLLSCTAIPLNLAVQGLLASAAGAGARARVRELVRAALRQSVAVGGLAAAIAWAMLARFPSVLTREVAVAARLRGLVPLCAATAYLWCQTTALYGVFVGLRLLGPFLRVHALSAAGALCVLLGGRFTRPDALVHAWTGAALYSALRLAFYAPSVVRVLARGGAEAEPSTKPQPGPRDTT